MPTWKVTQGSFPVIVFHRRVYPRYSGNTKLLCVSFAVSFVPSEHFPNDVSRSLSPTNHVIQQRYVLQFSTLYQCMSFIFLTHSDTVFSLPYVLNHLLTHKLTFTGTWMHTHCWQSACPSPFLIAGSKNLSVMLWFSAFFVFHLPVAVIFPYLLSMWFLWLIFY